jgi:hypothetical protein
MEIFMILIILFISGAFIGYLIRRSKRKNRVEVWMFLEKSNDVLWGSVKIKEMTISTYGYNVEQVKHRMKEHLSDFIGIRYEDVEFVIKEMPIEGLN